MTFSVKSVLLASVMAFSALHPGPAADPGSLRIRGIWAECEGVNSTLSSRAKIEEMISRCRQAGINTVFLQVYRGNKAWYHSSISDSSPFREFYEREKTDPLKLAIEIAHRYGIRVHAWINMFRVWGNRDALVIGKLGKEAVTRDVKGRSLLDYSKGMLPDSGYWLDPGDIKVKKHLLGVIDEITRRYPGIDGVHLDYVRYPFDEKGKVDFGYAKASAGAFRKKYGFFPAGCPSSKRPLWDAWRRDQVTGFVREAKKIVAARNKKLSAAVVPDIDKCERLTFQDWPRWIREGLVDYVAIMNYSENRKRVRKNTEAAIASAGDPKAVLVGLGVYKVLDAPDNLIAQIKGCAKSGAGGVVLFSYDNMTKRPKLFSVVGGRAFRAKPRGKG